MDIQAEIERRYQPHRGCVIHIRKGTLQRRLVIFPTNKWDVWGYAGEDGTMVMIRGDARQERDSHPAIREGSKKVLGISVSDYLLSWELK